MVTTQNEPTLPDPGSKSSDEADRSDNPRYQLRNEANKIFMASQTYDLLDFGRNFPTEQGGAGWLDSRGNIDKSRGIQTWITARMTHVYSVGTFLGYPQAKELVHRGVMGLQGHLHDDKNGGWYPSISWDGQIEQNKTCYTHAFVLLAATSAVLAGDPDAPSLQAEAMATFDKYFWDDDRGLTVDTWNTAFTELDSYRGLNANMHTTEAFLAVADSTGREEYRTRAGRIIDQVISWARGNDWRIPEHFNQDWKADLEYNQNNKTDQFKPYGATPGHGIEWARLITQYALSRFDQIHDRAPYINAAECLFARAIQDGWAADGNPGIIYTTDWNGNPVVDDRMHWTLAEALNTTASLQTATGKPIYADWYRVFCQYVDQHLIDHKEGSWFHQLNKQNQVVDTVWPGKSDLYHAFQSTLVPYHDPSLSIAVAVQKACRQDSATK